MRFAPHFVFLVLGGLNAICLVFLTPPFQVHDEFQHFFRSYQLSEGEIWGEIVNGRAGANLPLSLSAFVRSTWGTLEIWTAPPKQPRPLVATWKEIDRPLLPEQEGFADFSGAAAYSPLAYAPQVAAIALGRWLELSPLVLLYLGRLANALASVALIAWSIRLLPVGRWAATAIALLPMAQYEYGSVAPDALIIGCAYLYTALAIRAGLRTSWTWRSGMLACVAGLVFCSIKIVYAPVLFLNLPAILPARSRRGSFVAAQLGIALVVLVLSVAWTRSTQSVLEAVVVADTQRQHVAEILASPMSQVRLILRDALHHGAFYVQDFIGIFGEANMPMPLAGYVAAAGAVLAALFVGARETRLGWPWLVWGAVVIVSTYVSVVTALSILMEAPRDWLIQGVQGRYFLPLGALGAAVLASIAAAAVPGTGKLLRLVIPALVLSTAIMDWTLISQFKLFSGL